MREIDHLVAARGGRGLSAVGCNPHPRRDEKDVVQTLRDGRALRFPTVLVDEAA